MAIIIPLDSSRFPSAIEVQNSPTLAAHFIHSLIWMQYNRKQLKYSHGMAVTNLYLSNKEFFDAIVDRYEKERGYRIQHHSVTMGIDWFLQGNKSTLAK